MKKTKYLIVGGGPAGITAIEGIRQRDKNGPIILVDREGEQLYSKVNFHLYLEGKISKEQLYLKPDNFYRANAVELVRGKVNDISLDKNAQLESGEEVVFEKLILCCGGAPRQLAVPGADSPNVFNFYSLQDIEKIHAVLASRSKFLIVGGGFITLDLIDALIKLGKEIVLVVRDARLLQEKVGERGSEIITRAISRGKVRCVFSAEAKSFDGTSAILSDGQKVDFDLCIVAIGIAPNLEIAKKLSLKIGRGVIVDNHQKTSLDWAFAAGDICEFEDPNSNEMMMPGNWFYAINSGRIAGTNAAGGDLKNETVPRVSKALFGKQLNFVGNINSKFETKEIAEGEKYVQVYLKDGKLVGAAMINAGDDFSKIINSLGKEYSTG